MEMKTILIHEGLADVIMTNQPEGKHHCVVVMNGDMRAHALRTGMQDRAVISYNHSEGMLYYQLQFEMIEIDNCYEVNIRSNPVTLNWLNWVDDGVVTDLWIAFYKDGKPTPIGSPVLLTS